MSASHGVDSPSTPPFRRAFEAYQVQSARLKEANESKHRPPSSPQPQKENFMEAIVRAQGRRLDDQRTMLPERNSIMSEDSRQSDTMLTTNSSEFDMRQKQATLKLKSARARFVFVFAGAFCSSYVCLSCCFSCVWLQAVTSRSVVFIVKIVQFQAQSRQSAFNVAAPRCALAVESDFRRAELAPFALLNRVMIPLCSSGCSNVLRRSFSWLLI